MGVKIYVESKGFLAGTGLFPRWGDRFEAKIFHDLSFLNYLKKLSPETLESGNFKVIPVEID